MDSKIINAITLKENETVIINEFPINEAMITAICGIVSLDNAARSISALAQDFLFCELNKKEEEGRPISANTVLLGIELMDLLAEHDELDNSIRKKHGKGLMSSFVESN